ncbi:MAG: membrane protein insertion efficiency factor YidD [Clostridia bacterium]|nr:membrane protein insertion efficiency factor YidD [Clostridia bacterium]
MNKLAILLLKAYKATLSRVLGKSCIFAPSCSVYSMECYQSYNFFTASFLTLKRLLRCNPRSKGGFDPVPYNKKGKGKWFL